MRCFVRSVSWPLVAAGALALSCGTEANGDGDSNAGEGGTAGAGGSAGSAAQAGSNAAGKGGSSGTSGTGGTSGEGGTGAAGVAGTSDSGGSSGSAGTSSGSGGTPDAGEDGVGGAGAAGESNAGAAGSGLGGEAGGPTELPVPEGVTFIKADHPDMDDVFGVALSLSGDTLAVGAPGEDSGGSGLDGDEADDSARNSGAVYVYVRSDAGWRRQAYVKASNTGADDSFGDAVALFGNVLAVSAPDEDSLATGIDGDDGNDSANGAGAVYIFERTGSVWAQTAYIKASNTHAAANFGTSLALTADTLVVGAAYEGDDDQGAAYVFRRVGDTWEEEAILRAEQRARNDMFGWSVATSGDRVAVGSPSEDGSTTGVNGNQLDSGAPFSGAAYVFLRTSAGFVQEAYVKASNTGDVDFFGRVVALEGDTLVASAPAEDNSSGMIDSDGTNNNRDGAGAAYVFERGESGWAQQAYLKAPNPLDQGQGLGSCLSLEGNTLLASAVNRPATEGDAVGGVYRFGRVGTTWTLDETIIPIDTTGGPGFGWGLDHEGSTIVIGQYVESSLSSGVGGGPTAQDVYASHSGAVWIVEQ